MASSGVSSEDATDAEGRDARAAAEQARRKAEAMGLLNAHPFRPAPWLPSAHLQTVWSVFYRERPEVQPRRERWETPDGDFLNVYTNEGEAGRPVVLVLHGLEGCAQSNYVLGLMEAFGRIGWTTVAFEHRSCGPEMNRTCWMYHSGETRDLEFVVARLIETRPELRLYIAGFSLGGNVTAKWLGVVGEAAPPEVRGAAAVCPPFDLTISGPHLDTVLFGAYTRWFLRSLIPKALAKVELAPDRLNPELIRECRTFLEYDTHATAALYGYKDAWDYWASVSCGQFLGGVRRPMLLIAAQDDPFNPPKTLPREVAERSPFLHPQFPKRGGHVGFIYGTWRNSRHWAEEQIVRFFRFYEEAGEGSVGEGESERGSSLGD